MTVLVGVKCSDGVVIGADSIATSAHGNSRLLQTQTDKIQIIEDKLIVAASGSVGLSQRFTNVVYSSWKNKLFMKDPWECLKAISASTIQDFRSTHVPYTLPPQGLGFSFGALLAAPIGDQPYLVEYDGINFQPELRDGKPIFVSVGSGQLLAEPFVAFVSRVLWQEKVPDVKTAMFGVYWALDHTINFAPGGVGEPIKIATLRREKGQWKSRLLDDNELQEQAQHIEEIETRLGQYPKEILEEPKIEAPPTPPPKEE